MRVPPPIDGGKSVGEAGQEQQREMAKESIEKNAEYISYARTSRVTKDAIRFGRRIIKRRRDWKRLER